MLNLVLSFVPITVKAPMQTKAIKPATKPYSIAVAADVSCRNRRKTS